MHWIGCSFWVTFRCWRYVWYLNSLLWKSGVSASTMTILFQGKTKYIYFGALNHSPMRWKSIQTVTCSCQLNAFPRGFVSAGTLHIWEKNANTKEQTDQCQLLGAFFFKKIWQEKMPFVVFVLANVSVDWTAFPKRWGEHFFLSLLSMLKPGQETDCLTSQNMWEFSSFKHHSRPRFVQTYFSADFLESCRKKLVFLHWAD